MSSKERALLTAPIDVDFVFRVTLLDLFFTFGGHGESECSVTESQAWLRRPACGN